MRRRSEPLPAPLPLHTDGDICGDSDGQPATAVCARPHVIVYNMCIVYRGAIRQTFCVLVIIRIFIYYLFIVYFVLPHPGLFTARPDSLTLRAGGVMRGQICVFILYSV